MILRARAPLRISFCGGGTDVPPYPTLHGGCVLNCTIDKYCYASLVTTLPGLPVSIQSLDYNIVSCWTKESVVNPKEPMALVKAVLQRMGIHDGCNIFLHSDTPPGSGLGASSALTVALVSLLLKYKRETMDDYDLAELAHAIEREDCAIKGGRQDQYAAVFGGFNFMEFLKDSTIVFPVKIKKPILYEMQYRLMLCYTGKQRASAGIIEDQTKRYHSNENKTALELYKELTKAMLRALLLGKIDEVGDLLHQSWMTKQKFSDRISNPQIDKLYHVGRDSGALGGKILGAGGGGYLLFLCQFDRWNEVGKALESAGGKIMPFAFDLNGVQTWQANGIARGAEVDKWAALERR